MMLYRLSLTEQHLDDGSITLTATAREYDVQLAVVTSSEDDNLHTVEPGEVIVEASHRIPGLTLRSINLNHGPVLGPPEVQIFIAFHKEKLATEVIKKMATREQS